MFYKTHGVDMKDYFPSRLAMGNRFCNRVTEQETLRRNIELGRHTVLVSPRRYGKSSLVHKVVGDMGLPAAYIDFFMAHDDKAITLRLLNGISDILSQIMPISKKTLTVLERYFVKLKLALSVKGVSFSLSYNEREFDAVAQIHEALKGLVALVKKQNQKVIVFIDEFQDIINAESSRAIQGTLRGIAQEFEEIVFIFSGSSRHLLLDIFDDKAKPFYMLCDKLELDRMTSLHYHSYIQHAAIEKWGKELSDEAFKKMMSVTELHPFYINMLGNQLCKLRKLPDEVAVDQAWRQCFELEQRRLVAEIEHLTLNQQRVVKFFARNPVMEPTAQSVLNEIKISGASMNLCLKFLLERDLVSRVTFEDTNVPLFKKDQYRVLDPLLAYSLRQYS